MNIRDTISGKRGDILSLLSLLDGSLIAQDSDSYHLEQMIRCQSKDYLHQFLHFGKENGFSSVVVTGSPVLFRTVHNPSQQGFPEILPVVPNIRGLMREAVEHGMIKAGMRRAWRVGPIRLGGLGMRSIGKVGLILKKDFPTLLSCLVELEVAEFVRYHSPLYLLQAQITDLAVVMNNPLILQAYIRCISRTSDSGIGYETFNFTRTASFLKRWGLRCDAIIAPWERNGNHMRESKEECVRILKQCSYPVWGMLPGRFAPPVKNQYDWAKDSGLAGMVRDDYDSWGTG